jgi:hypothetical protein
MYFKQDLFYGNILYSKGKVLKKLDFLKHSLGNRSFIKNLNNPYFIWTGTGKIQSLETMKLDIKTINKVRKKNLDFYFYLYEPICARIGNFNRSFYSEFTSDADLSNIICDELESIKVFTENNSIENFRVFTCDYNIQLIQKNYPQMNLCCLDIFLREVSSSYTFKSQKENSIQKKFWCGNWRYTVHRHLVTSYLINLDGIYSWNIKCPFEKLLKNEWFNFDLLKDNDANRFFQIKNGADQLFNKIFSIDIMVESLTVEHFSEVVIPGETHRSIDFLDSYKKCFCAVVNETRFAQPFGNFSEKTLTAIYSKLPFVLVAPPFSLEYLRKFGFRTFGKWWDESYDLEKDHHKRIIKIFDIIDYINSKSIEELREIYTEMDEILDHNLKVIRTIPMNNIPF